MKHNMRNILTNVIQFRV